MKGLALLATAALGLASLSCNKPGFKGNNASADAAADQQAFIDASASGLNAVTESITISKNVDLIVALDSSGSMDEERAAVSANLNKMILALQKGSLDPKIHVIAGAGGEDDSAAPDFVFPPEVDASKVALVVQPVGSHDALGHVTQTLNGAYASSYKTIKGVAMTPPLAFRADAKLEVLVISDDNATKGKIAGTTSLDFDTGNKFKATVSGVIGTATSVQADGVCEIAAVGVEYITLAGKTGGTILDICSNDWSKIIERFSTDILKRSQSIHLSRVPLNPDKILVALGGKILPKDAYTYDPATRLITLAASVNLAFGLELKVNYEAVAG